MTEIEITELFGPRCAEFDAGCTSCYVWRAYDEIKRLTYERDEWRDADRAECAENARLRAQIAECERTIARLSGFTP